jgi:hypothetical protein
VARLNQKSSVPTKHAVPQRIRWFQVRQPILDEAPADAAYLAERDGLPLGDFIGLDVSGSQAQILAVVMGLRQVEEQLHEMPFKRLVALSMRALHKRGTLVLPRELTTNDTLLENVAKGAGMPGLYGGRPSNIAAELRRDPDRYGPGLDTAGVQTVFRRVPILQQLLAFLPICKAVGVEACKASPTAGVTVVDPLDRVSFTWNPPARRKVQVGSGAFKLYVHAPVLHANGDPIVDKGKLVRRIAPGLIHMLDALYAAIVVTYLNERGVRDVVAVHDAFLVPKSTGLILAEAVVAAGRLWLPHLGPFYDAFERYLPASTREGQIVRGWHAKWAQRVTDCEAGRDTWPDFRTKPEGSEYR